jgi:FAD/FMN-containing dehydrogenase
MTLVRWANDTGTGLIPVSSTGHRRRGDTVPSRGDTVIVDLSPMKQLLHVDARDKIAIIEPGVDFGTIDTLLLPHKLRAYRPLAPRAGKSLLTSYLEREPIIAPNDHWDVGDPFGGTAVVLGNGRYAPTGGAAITGTLPEQLARGHRHMVPVGPVNLDILRVLQGAQGSLGVMAWAAVYCERIPVQEEAFFASAEQLEPVIDLARELLHRRLGNALFIVDRVQLALLLATDLESFHALRSALPAWSLFVSLAADRFATQDKMAWQRADLESCAAAQGAGLHTALAGRKASDLSRLLRRPDSTSFRDRTHGGHRELFFLQQLDRVASFLPIVQGCLARAELGSAPLGVYIQPMAQGVSCHIEFTLPFNPRQTDEAMRSQAAWAEAATQCAQAGGFFSRPYGAWSEMAFARDPAIRPLMTMTKSIFDPRGVMNPGRLPY